MSHPDDFNEQESLSTHEQAAEWFVRMDAGQLTPLQKMEFERWINADPDNRREYRAIQGIWKELDGLKDSDSFKDLSAMTGRRYQWAWHPLALAATLMIFVLTGLLALVYEPGSYETAKGELQTIRLEDDSVVRLNSDTLLKVEMTETQRTARLLRGEAYFEVSHDTHRPFVVVSAGGAIRAVGTQFNVYLQSSKVRVTVVEGRVEVATEDGAACLLNADEMVAYNSDGQTLSQIERPKQRDLDWLDGRLNFEATPLVDVVTQLNRYLETPLRISDPGINQLRLSGTFRISNLETLPKLLPRLLPISLEHTGDDVLLRRSM